MEGAVSVVYVPCEANHTTFLGHRRRSAIKINLNIPILKTGGNGKSG